MSCCLITILLNVVYLKIKANVSSLQYHADTDYTYRWEIKLSENLKHPQSSSVWSPFFSLNENYENVKFIRNIEVLKHCLVTSTSRK